MWKELVLNSDKKEVEILKFFEMKNIPFLKLVDISFSSENS